MPQHQTHWMCMSLHTKNCSGTPTTSQIAPSSQISLQLRIACPRSLSDHSAVTALSNKVLSSSAGPELRFLDNQLRSHRSLSPVPGKPGAPELGPSSLCCAQEAHLDRHKRKLLRAHTSSHRAHLVAIPESGHLWELHAGGLQQHLRGLALECLLMLRRVKLHLSSSS